LHCEPPRTLGRSTLQEIARSKTLDSYLTQVSNRLDMALHIHLHGSMILVFAQFALAFPILTGLRWRKVL
jgi:hypothetical protein